MKLNRLIKILLFSLMLSLAACNSNSTDSDASPTDDRFVPGDSNSGSIQLILNEERVPTAEITGFKVLVKDKDGAGVSNIRVTCDTEQGIALVEPSTGSFLTDSSGHASGKFGCDRPGSFQVGCRLNAGANKRVLKTIICEGPRPEGFEGFPNAGGGTLGGGVADFDDDDPFLVRVTGITVNDGGVDTSTIDLNRVVCTDPDGIPGNGDEVLENFTDSTVQFTIENNGDKLVRFTSYFFTVKNYDGNGSSATSDTINFINETAVNGNGGTGDTSALFLEIGEGSGVFNPGKRIPFNSVHINSNGSSGFKSVEFTLIGQDSAGNSVRIKARQSLAFGAYNNC